ncbi:hypothetical protein [Chenggangzhangella methanolivorans]|uniref:hypothetical protein n=1 Tax=Chenggangzhangella methanolivorans TaxID=1437009 RepID=UPI0021BD15D6|nr:hypothetical protein [Chenggangzhangella methanolivorans]
MYSTSRRNSSTASVLALALEREDALGRLVDGAVELGHPARRLDVGELAPHLLEIVHRRDLGARHLLQPLEGVAHLVPRLMEIRHLLGAEQQHLGDLLRVVVGVAVELGDDLEPAVHGVDPLHEVVRELQRERHHADHHRDKDRGDDGEDDDAEADGHGRIDAGDERAGTLAAPTLPSPIT